MVILYETLHETLKGKIGFPHGDQLMDAAFTQNKAKYLLALPADFVLPHHEVQIPVVDDFTDGTVNISEIELEYLQK
jgi:hypothetical protein